VVIIHYSIFYYIYLQIYSINVVISKNYFFHKVIDVLNNKILLVAINTYDSNAKRRTLEPLDAYEYYFMSKK
jgi:hypothetical protein